jgi:peptide/nickel transport system substrate-binding protein
MKNKNFLLVLILLTFSILVSSCGRKKDVTTNSENAEFTLTELIPEETKEAVVGDWIIKQEMADAEKLNPTVTNDATASEIDFYIFEPLVDVNRVTYEVKPVIAKAPPVMSDDHLSYTFDLNENVTFSDGKPLTGEDVIFTIKTIVNPFTDAQSLRNYFADFKSVELVDGNKYKIKMTMTKPYFKTVFTIGNTLITPRHILDPDNVNAKFSWEDLANAQKTLDIEKYSEMHKFADFLNSQEVSRDAKYVVGSGPYKLDKWITGQSVTLSRNDNYWNIKEFPNYPAKIIFKTIQDQNAAVVAAKNKETDYMTVIQPIDFVENVKDPEQYNLKKSLVTEPSYSYIAWNNKSPLFSDKNVRWAMSYAIDRQSILNSVVYGMGTLIQSPIFIKSKYYDSDLKVIPYDPAKSKELLAAAGWKDSDGDGILDKVIDGKKMDFKFTFINNNNPKRKKVMLIIIQNLKQLGIQADLQEYEWSVFLDKTKKHEYDACYAAWLLGVTPEDPYQIWHSSQSEGEGSNFISYNNPESDRILVENRTLFDETQRVQLLKEWQQIIYEDQPVTFLWSEPTRFLYSDRYKNTRWYAYPNSPLLNEWWTPMAAQRYKN